MSEKKKIWVVKGWVYLEELEDQLNALADEGYHVHNLIYCEDKFHVVAVNPALMGEKQMGAMQEMLAQVNKTMGIGGMGFGKP